MSDQTLDAILDKLSVQPTERECAWCGSDFTGVRMVCSDACNMAYQEHLRRNGFFSRTVPAPFLRGTITIKDENDPR